MIGVELRRAPVDELGAACDESADSGKDGDLARLDARQRADVDHRRSALLAQLAQRRHARARQPVAADVADRDVAQQARQRVADRRRQARQHDRGLLGRPAEDVAMDDVDGRADRERDGDAVLGEIEGDLGAGVAHADDEHALAGERRRVAVVAAVDDPPAGPNRSSPSIFGANGWLFAPVVTTTASEAKVRPERVEVRQRPAGSRTIAVASSPKHGSMPACAA